MVVAVRSRGEYAKSAARREEILAAGVHVFSMSGFRSGSIREIADRVGMSQAGLLHHFASKSELLEAVLTHRDDIARAHLAGADGLPAGVEMLRGMVELVRSNARTPGLIALYCTLSAEATSPDHPAHRYFRDRYEYVLGLMRQAFEEAREQGHLRDGVDPAGAARQMIAVMDGLQVQWLLDPVFDMGVELRGFLRTLVTVEL